MLAMQAAFLQNGQLERRLHERLSASNRMEARDGSTFAQMNIVSIISDVMGNASHAAIVVQ